MILNSMTVSFHEILSQSAREHRDLQHNYIENELRLMGLLAGERLAAEQAAGIPSGCTTCFPGREDLVSVLQNVPITVYHQILILEGNNVLRNHS